MVCDFDRKINIASYKVLRTLLTLFKKSMTMNELVSTLDNSDCAPYNNFVASKYIHTCKSCGVDIQKIGGVYYVVNMPIGKKFTSKDSELLYELKAFADREASAKSNKIMTVIMDKVHMPFYKIGTGIKSSKNARVIKLFEKACFSKSGITVVFKDGANHKYEPECIHVKGNKIYFYVKSSDGDFEINPDEVIDIKLDKKNAPKPKFDDSVIFEIYGDLAKRYQPREYEDMTTHRTKKCLVVTNKYEDRTELMHRLLRYGSLCKVVQPQSFVDDMKTMLRETLSNYDN